MDKHKLMQLLRQEEGSKLDFKAALHLSTESEKKEISKDVSYTSPKEKDQPLSSFFTTVTLLPFLLYIISSQRLSTSNIPRPLSFKFRKSDVRSAR